MWAISYGSSTIAFIINKLQGIYIELIGPTLLDLKDRVAADYEEISRALVARSVGYFCAAMVGGTLADR